MWERKEGEGGMCGEDGMEREVWGGVVRRAIGYTVCMSAPSLGT